MIDFLEHLDKKSAPLEVEDNIDVFERYAENPDEAVFEAFDE